MLYTSIKPLLFRITYCFNTTCLISTAAFIVFSFKLVAANPLKFLGLPTATFPTVKAYQPPVISYVTATAKQYRAESTFNVAPGDTLKPLFTGGETKLGEFFGNNLQYPYEALKAKKSAYVVISATITKTGTASNIEIIKTSDKKFTAELKHAFNKMPKWRPATINGQYVKATYIFPVLFNVSGYEDVITQQEFSQIVKELASKKYPANELMYTATHFVISAEPLPEVVTVSKELNPMSEGEKKIYTFSEQSPEFPGGDKALYRFLKENIKPTSLALANNIHGQVVVRFIIEEDGSISDPQITKKLGYGLDQEVLRVINLLPKFKPAYQNNKPVSYHFSLPINF